MLLETEYRQALEILDRRLTELNDNEVVPGFEVQLPIGRTYAGGRDLSSLDKLMQRFAVCLSRRIGLTDTNPDNSWMKHLPSRRIETAIAKLRTAVPGNFMAVRIPTADEYFPDTIPNARTFRPGEGNYIPTSVTFPFEGRFLDTPGIFNFLLYPSGTQRNHIEIASLVDDRTVRQAYRGAVYNSKAQTYAANKTSILWPLRGGAWGQNS